MRISSLLSIAFLVSLLASCGGVSKVEEIRKPSGGRSAVFTTDTLAIVGAKNQIIRRSAPLGVFVAEYLSNASLETEGQGALDAIAIQTAILDAQKSVSDPDFELLQAFQDALQVDVSDLLNRSENRERALDAYSEALTNIATRANDRFRELSSSLEELKNLVRTLEKEKNTADRDVKKSLKDKEYEAASAAQKLLTEKETALAEAKLEQRQVNDIVSTLDQLLSVYGEKILAIQQNREILLSGMKIVDVPGIDDLKIIQRTNVRRTGTRSGADGSGTFDNLFEESRLP